LLKDRLRTLILGSPEFAGPPPYSFRPLANGNLYRSSEPKTRNSHGLDQFFGAIRDQTALRILDLAGASQANVTYITDLGHGLYAEDFLLALDAAFGPADFYENQSDPGRIQALLSLNLAFRDEHFDGALIWDSFQYLRQPVLEAVVERLHRIMRPNAYMLAFFHADEKAASLPLYSYRIMDSKTLLLTPRGQKQPAQFFNNRSLERLFQRFQSVKFFLTRDHLREVIVRR
jgi:hypothetical protein